MLWPSGAQADNPTRPQPLFRTPGNAAYCYFWLGGMEPLNPGVGCWTPNDGFTVTVAHDEPRGREDQRKSYRPRKPRAHRARLPDPALWRIFRVRCDLDGGSADRCLRGGRDVPFRW